MTPPTITSMSLVALLRSFLTAILYFGLYVVCNYFNYGRWQNCRKICLSMKAGWSDSSMQWVWLFRKVAEFSCLNALMAWMFLFMNVIIRELMNLCLRAILLRDSKWTIGEVDSGSWILGSTSLDGTFPISPIRDLSNHMWRRVIWGNQFVCRHQQYHSVLTQEGEGCIVLN